MKKKKLAITAVLTTSLTASSVLGSLPAVYALENTNVVQNNVEKNIEEDTLLTDIKDVSSSDLSGECGNTVNWKLTPIGNTDEYTLTISGTGTMKDYSSSSSDDFWPADKKAKITKIVIEEGVTKLGKFAFLGLSNVTSVDIAESVTSFSQGTFQSCKNLAGTINLNANFEDFSTEVFVDTKISKFTVDPNNKNYTVKNDILYSKDGKTIINCPPAKSATFSTEWLNGVSEIAPYAFRTCTQLKGTLEIPSNIVKIGKQAFQNCSGLAAENFVIPETVKEIDLKYTFANCKLTGTVTIPSHLTEIQDGAFNGCKIDGINWNGAKIKKIGSSIFTNNTNLKQINLPNTVTYIGNSTFSGCTNLTSIGTVELTYIGNSAFLGCTALENIGAVEQITYIGDTAFSGCTALGDIIKVDNIIHFGNNIFGNDNSKYTSKEINLTLENVEYIGENAFKGCTLKNDIIISEGATVEIGAFNDTTLEGGVTYLAKKIPNSLFKGKTLTHLIIGEKVENIETSVFNIATLPETVIIPETVTSYGEHMLQSVKGTKNLFLLGTPTLMPTAICYGGTYKNIVLGQDPADYKGQIGSDNKEIHDAFAHLPNGSCIYVPTSGEFLQITKKDTAIAVMNGGTIPTDTKFVEGKLATPVKKGYVFDGWYTKDGSNEGWGAKVEGNLEANKTYYAKWEKAIASVEGVGYTDLQTAIDNAEGKTVTIEKDNITKGNIELSKALEINNKKDITIDFNGVKLSKKLLQKLQITQIA